MCGIVGIVNNRIEHQVSELLLKKMADVVQHRGPDGEGFFCHKNIGLGQRRLSIIDLESGKQPIFNEDKSIVLVFNGEIYNYIELRESLKKKKHNFYTLSDAEVIIHAYEQWGYDCVNKLNGMWAFAIWDNNINELFISRDRLGQKPLYYTKTKNTFLFASEIKSLIAHGIPLTPNYELLEIYLSLGYIPAPYSFFKNVYKLRAGHSIIIKDGLVTEKKYWDLPEIDEGNMITDKHEVNTTFEYLLRDSVKLRMRCDVPFGAFLSGGLDSTTIVAIMSEISNYPIETFTIGFKEKLFDESHLAQLVASTFKTNHHLNFVNHDSFEQALEKIMFHFDEPFGDASAIPTNYVSSFASKKVKMVLTGDGGDEVLSGYTIYQGEKFSSQYNKTPKFIQKKLSGIFSLLSNFSSGQTRYQLNRINDVLSSSTLSFNERLLTKASWIEKPMLKELLMNHNVYSIEDYLSDFFKQCPYQDNFYKLMYYNLKLSLPDDMLVKVDRMSMANSLEARAPFLDYRIVEYMSKVDKKIKLPGYERKSVLKNTIGAILPRSILSSPKKGFVSPTREWFKDKQLEEKLDLLAKSNWGLEKQVISKLIALNKQGLKDYGNFIWMLFVIDSWMTKYSND
jgi:asparagine synthase (glutamine-hydrolysing)